MRMHDDISHEGILRQLVNVTPTIAKQNQEFKEDVALARYEPAANRALFIFDTMALARKWVNHSLPVQGHMLPLRLAHAGHAGGASPVAIVAIDEYEFMVIDTAGNYSAYQLWHLFDRILGLPVVQLLQQTATATGVLDPTRWTVVVKAHGCPPQIRDKTRLEHEGRKLWLHHTAFATHPPCSRCAEATHPTHSCTERQLVPGRILQVDGVIPSLADALAAAAREDPEQFAPWFQDLAKRQRVRRPLAASCMQAAEESTIVDGIAAIRALADASPEWFARHMSFERSPPDVLVEADPLDHLFHLLRVSVARPADGADLHSDACPIPSEAEVRAAFQLRQEDPYPRTPNPELATALLRVWTDIYQSDVRAIQQAKAEIAVRLLPPARPSHSQDVEMPCLLPDLDHEPSSGRPSAPGDPSSNELSVAASLEAENTIEKEPSVPRTPAPASPKKRSKKNSRRPKQLDISDRAAELPSPVAAAAPQTAPSSNPPVALMPVSTRQIVDLDEAALAQARATVPHAQRLALPPDEFYDFFDVAMPEDMSDGDEAKTDSDDPPPRRRLSPLRPQRSRGQVAPRWTRRHGRQPGLPDSSCQPMPLTVRLTPNDDGDFEVAIVPKRAPGQRRMRRQLQVTTFLVRAGSEAVMPMDIDLMDTAVADIGAARTEAAPTSAVEAPAQQNEPMASATDPDPDVLFLQTVPYTPTASASDDRWQQLKDSLGLVEIETPRNGSCFCYMVYAMYYGVCELVILPEGRALREATHVRTNVYGILVGHFDELVDVGVIDLPAACRRVAPNGDVTPANVRRVVDHFARARSLPCDAPLATADWATENEIRTVAYWLAQPLVIFERCVDGRTFAQLYYECPRPIPAYTGQATVRQVYMSTGAACEFVSALIAREIIPHVGVLTHTAAGGGTLGHFTALRVQGNRYGAWAGSKAKRAAMNQRLAQLMHDEGYHPDPGHSPQRTEPARQTDTPASSASGSVYEPSQSITDTSLEEPPRRLTSPREITRLPMQHVTKTELRLRQGLPRAAPSPVPDRRLRLSPDDAPSPERSAEPRSPGVLAAPAPASRSGAAPEMATDGAPLPTELETADDDEPPPLDPVLALVPERGDNPSGIIRSDPGLTDPHGLFASPTQPSAGATPPGSTTSEEGVPWATARGPEISVPDTAQPDPSDSAELPSPTPFSLPASPLEAPPALTVDELVALTAACHRDAASGLQQLPGYDVAVRANRLAYGEWRAGLQRSSPRLYNHLRNIDSVGVACESLETSPAHLVELLSSLPHVPLVCKHAKCTLLQTIGREVFIQARMHQLRDLADNETTPALARRFCLEWADAIQATQPHLTKWRLTHSPARKDRLVRLLRDTDVRIAALDGIADEEWTHVVGYLLVITRRMHLPAPRPFAVSARALMDGLLAPDRRDAVLALIDDFNRGDWAAAHLFCGDAQAASTANVPATRPPFQDAGQTPVTEPVARGRSGGDGGEGVGGQIALCAGSRSSLKTKHHNQQVDVIFIQETRATGDWATVLADKYARAWGYEPNRLDRPLSYWHGTERPAGGVAILLHPHAAITEVRPLWQEHWASDFMALTGLFDNEPVTLINVYASSDLKRARDELFDRIRSLERPPGLVLLGGDFNCVLDRELDRSRSAGTATETDQLQVLLTDWALSDAAAQDLIAVETESDKRTFHSMQHTYRYRYDESEIASSRIDRWYLPTEHLPCLYSLDVSVPVGRSDHDAVRLTILEQSPPHQSGCHRRRRALRYPLPSEGIVTARTQAQLLLATFVDEMARLPPREIAMRWDALKVEIRTRTLVALAQQRKKIRHSFRQRRKRLRALLRSAQDDPVPVDATVDGIVRGMDRLTLDRHERWAGARAALIELSEAQAQRRRQRTFQQYTGNGHDAAKAFYRRINTRFCQRLPARLPVGPGISPDPAERMAMDWRPITQRSPVPPALQDQYFRRLPPARAVIQSPPPLLPFTQPEVEQALQACPRGKASGPDGLPNDWYRDHADLVAPLLTALFNKWYVAGTLPHSFSAATVYCIPKTSSPATGLDYRPIALLNSDYKIFSRLLLARVQPQLERIVSPTQFGFVPNRQTHDALDLWTAIKRLVDDGRASTRVTAILLDFAKAYDTLDRRFLTLALRRLCFPEQFLRAVEALHLATTAAYLADGQLSGDHEVFNGIRQGCPLAPVLFVLAVDTLYDQLEATPALTGVRLPTGEKITAAGYADDTTVYLADPAQARPLRSALLDFGTASGLQINFAKCHAIAVARSGWPADVGDIGFPRLPADHTARLLGRQIGSAPRDKSIWDLTIKQLRVRLQLAQVKTTDVLQRTQVASAIIIPKLLYVGRHQWPAAKDIQALQRLLHNYVWHGRFERTVPGRAWLSVDVAALPLGDGGLGVPDLTTELLQLSVRTTHRWMTRRVGLGTAVGLVLLGDVEGRRPPPPSRQPRRPARLRASLVTTGLAITAALTTQPRTETETAKCLALLQHVGHGTTSTRRWAGDWYVTDYAADLVALRQLRRLQTAHHGVFDLHALLRAPIAAGDTLLVPAGRPAVTRDFPGVVTHGDTVGDVLDIQWVARGIIRFRCRKGTYPLPPRAVRSFRFLCDVVVYNYPAVLLPHDPCDVIRVTPPTINVWRLERMNGTGLRLIWEPSAGLHVPAGIVHTVADVTATARALLGDPHCAALPHPWLHPITTIWRPPSPLVSKTSVRRHVRAAKIRRGLQENECRAGRLLTVDHDIGTALGSFSWHSIDRMLVTTSRQRLRVRRLKGDRVSGWDRLHQRWGCPHCPEHTEGGTILHIFWACPAAQNLWRVLWTGWAQYNLWQEPAPGLELKMAIFQFRLPRFPGLLWRHPAIHSIAFSDSASTGAIHSAVHTAWQQHVHDVLSVIWRWRHDIVGDQLRWSLAGAQAYLHAALRTTLLSLGRRLHPLDTLRDPRRPLLRSMADAFREPVAPAGLPAPSLADSPIRLLFFDGGSRGNPGPGGAGAVLVETDADAINPRVLWSACMAYGRPTMTNNRAEYLGLVAGLREACRRGWCVEVVGDSALIIRQLSRFFPPKHPQLRPLYSEARRLADVAGVTHWHHHRRHHNRMADLAANTAMNLSASVQTTHPSGWPHTASIDALLADDFEEWRARRLLSHLHVT